MSDSKIPTQSPTLQTALEDALDKIDTNVDTWDSTTFPEPASDSSFTYSVKPEPSGWTPGFWTGMVWLADRLRDADRYRDLATRHLEQFERRLDGDELLDHDLGFLYTPTAWATFDATGSESARQIALRAADELAGRFHEAPGIIQAWGDHRPRGAEVNPEHYGGAIIDTMMNLPLLFRAANHTGYRRYAEVASAHAETTAEYAVRDDGSTAHGFTFDVDSGAFEGQETHQGDAADSCWSRGQAWAIYGFALAYRHTGAAQFLETARAVAEYYIDAVSGDWAPVWDFRAREGTEDRDSSAAAIAACGLLELGEHLPPADPNFHRYTDIALETLRTLATDYTAPAQEAGGILTDGAYAWKSGEYEQSTLWGDYFYLEGLTRSSSDWESPWARW